MPDVTKRPDENENTGATCQPRTTIQWLCEILAKQKKNIQNLSSLVFVNFAVAGVGFVTQLKIANVLGKESFGMIAYGMSIATYGMVFIRFGLEKTLVRDLIHFPDRYTATVKASLVLRFTLLALFITAILGWKMVMPKENDLSWGVIFIVIANTSISVDLQGVYDSWHKMTRHALYNLLQKGLYFSIIWTILLVNPNILSIFSVGAATLLSVFFYLALQYFYVMKRLPSEFSGVSHVAQAIDLARGNIVVWLAALGGLSFGTLNQLVLKQYHGALELGGYAASWMMVTMVTILLTQVARVGNPSTARITAGDASSRQRLQFLLKYASIMVVLILPISSLVIICPEWVLMTLFKPEYMSASSALRVLGFYMLAFSFGLAAEQYIVSARMDKEYMQSVLIGGAVGVILCFTIIPRYGAVGAALALLLSHGLSLVLYWLRVVVSLLPGETPRMQR